VRLPIDTKDATSSIRISFTDQRLTAHGGMIVWSQQFGIKRLCVDNFWGTEAMHHLAIAADNLCVLLQRRLGQLEKCELNTLRWRWFGRAAVWRRARGQTHPQARRAGVGASNLVARYPDQTHRSTQLPCSSLQA